MRQYRLIESEPYCCVTSSLESILLKHGYNFDQIAIAEFEHVSEEDDMSKISFGYLNKLFPDNIKDSELDIDTVAAIDTAAVDLAY